MTLRHHLPGRRAPLLVVQVGADPENRKLVVTELRHTLVRMAEQDIDEMRGSKALPGAVDAGEQLLRDHGAVMHGRRRQAIIAIPAGVRRCRLAEIAEHVRAPAAGGLGQAHQRIELTDRYALERVGGPRLVDHAPLLNDVAEAIGHPGNRGLAVAARAPGLLIVGLDALGQIEMRDEAHIWLVDAHAKRDRGNDHDAVLVDEAILVARPHTGVEAGMVWQRPDAGPHQCSRCVLDLGARQAIDDPRVSRMAPRDERLELRLCILLVDDLVADVRAVEARHEARSAGQAQAVDDLLARQRIRGGGERDAWHVWKALREHGEPDIFRAEIMTPLRYAVRFVDREQSEACTG